MKVTFITLFIALLPITSIFSLGYFFPAGRQVYKPVFQPPSWVFGLVWTIVSLAFGFTTAIALDKMTHHAYIYVFYTTILLGLLAWLPLNSYKQYGISFYLLVGLSYLSLCYVAYLSYQRVMEWIALLPLSFWLIFASCLNGVIYNNASHSVISSNSII